MSDRRRLRAVGGKGLSFAVLVGLAVLAWAFDLRPTDGGTPAPPVSSQPAAAPPAGSQVEAAYAAQRSGLMTQARGTVRKTLRDDNDGSRHQRFLLELPSGHTVLVAHNIDLADRVPLERGDTVEVRGQYEWNDRGGVLHWTHHDPAGRHDEGWIRHAGRVYE